MRMVPDAVRHGSEQVTLIGFWHEWGSTIEWGAAAFGGWWAKAAANRMRLTLGRKSLLKDCVLSHYRK